MEENTERAKSAAMKNGVYEWLQGIVFSLLCVILLFTFVGRLMSVSGSSMLETLEDQDMMLVSHLFYTPKNGDVVIIGRADEKPLVKRIIATEGQEVSIDFKAGEVRVDGRLLDEPYIRDGIMTERGRGDFNDKTIVPKGHVFVMGDNRDNSRDSRYNSVGTIDARQIMGRVYMVLAPFDNFGLIK